MKCDITGNVYYENGIVNRGNLTRLSGIMKRARAGEALTIGFLGGSITQGSLSAAPERCYAYLVFEWWRSAFPEAQFTYINAGIGATDSQFGCARVKEDLLCHNPDFVVIDFSVNDDCTEHFMETYEGVIRRVYGWKSKPAVLLLHNVYYDTGANAQLLHGRVGRYYELPAVSMQSSIYPALLSGAIENREITPDNLHPNDAGHALVASVITYFLAQVKKETEAECRPEAGAPASGSAEDTGSCAAELRKEPLTLNRYEHSTRYRNDCGCAQCSGFVPDDTPQHGITDVFKNGWMAAENGDSITVEAEGTCIAVQYRKTVHHPAPKAEVLIDGDADGAVLLDAAFEEDWGDKLALVTAGENLSAGTHRVTVRIAEAHADDALPFYLASVIGSVPRE